MRTLLTILFVAGIFLLAQSNGYTPLPIENAEQFSFHAATVHSDTTKPKPAVAKKDKDPRRTGKDEDARRKTKKKDDKKEKENN